MTRDEVIRANCPQSATQRRYWNFEVGDVLYLLDKASRLESELAEQRALVEQLTLERDAAVRDIEWYANEFQNDEMHCDFCKHVGEPCWHNNGECNWEWRGPVARKE